MLLSACGVGGYQFKDVAKTDTSLVMEVHRKQTRELLRTLTVKLYKRNPRELPGNQLVKERLNSLFASASYLESRECGPEIETALMERSLAIGFRGDRVFCLMAGLIGMFNHSYNYKLEFYITDSLDEQKLYKSARNVERLAWRLRNSKSESGEPLLLSNSTEAGHINLSFERLFGKLIAHQDALAEIMADKNKRAINYMVRSLGSFFFVPL